MSCTGPSGPVRIETSKAGRDWRSGMAKQSHRNVCERDPATWEISSDGCRRLLGVSLDGYQRMLDVAGLLASDVSARCIPTGRVVSGYFILNACVPGGTGLAVVVDGHQ